MTGAPSDCNRCPALAAHRTQVVWRAISGWPYEISSSGVLRHTSGRIRKVHPTGWGYPIAELWRGDGGRGERKFVALHNLVAEHFLGPRPLEKEVNHKDGIKMHNCSANLEYMTRSENLYHAYATGLNKRENHSMPGERHPNAKLLDTDIPKIRTLAKQGLTQKEIARRFSVCANTVGGILRADNWRHV